MAQYIQSIPDWAKRIQVLVADIEALEQQLAQKKAELDSLSPRQAAAPAVEAVASAPEAPRGGKREAGQIGNIGHTGRVMDLLKANPGKAYTASAVCEALGVSQDKRQQTQIALMRLMKAKKLVKAQSGGYAFPVEASS